MKFSTPSLFIVIAIAFCCSEEEQDNSNTTVEYEPAITPVGIPAGDPITKTIGISGGTIASPDGVIELVIPAGALPANTDITIQPVTNEAPGGIGLAYDLLPDGTTFSKPATLTFHYTDEDINGSSPFFIYIAYQDESGTWVSDLKNQVLDTQAKTTSLDINHFTIMSMGADYPRIVGGPLTLRAGQASIMFVIESFVIEGPNGERRTQSEPVPANLVSNWKVNSMPGGNSSNGTIVGTGASAVYKAPAYIETRRTVQISAHINVTITTYDRGRRTVIHGLDPVIEVTLEPQAPRKYEISILYVDSVISPFYGRKGAAIPVYRDRAKFNLDLKFVNHVVEVEVSNIDNDPPVVNPATITYSGTEFTWDPDTIGVMDIEHVKLHSTGVLADSILRFSLVHKNATLYGRILKTLANGHIERQPPGRFGVGFGYPSTFEVDLKRTGAYFDPSQDVDTETGQPVTRGGIHISVSIVPH